MTIPNGWHIKYNPKPIPIRGHDWDFWHDEVDNDSRLCGTAGSEEDAKHAIMEKQAERHGFDKYADEPDDFDSHVNIESLQYIIADMQRDLLSRENQITALIAKPQAENAELKKELLDTTWQYHADHWHKLADIRSAEICRLETEIATLRESMRWRTPPELPNEGQRCVIKYAHGPVEFVIVYSAANILSCIERWLPLPPEDSSDE